MDIYYTPYTYLIGWSKLDKWYYGVRYSKKCNPADLWVTYFTSSKTVKEYRALHGEPDVIQVRRIFPDADKAKRWENEVLRRSKVVRSEKWINKTASYSFPLRDISGDKNPMRDPEVAKRVANSLKKSGKERMANLSPDERKRRWGKSGSDNPFYGKSHTKESKDKISLGVSNGSQHDQIKCHVCDSFVSKVNFSRHLYSCTDGKEGTKGNPTRTGITMKKWGGKSKCVTDGISTKRIPKEDAVPDGWFLGRHYRTRN